MPDLRTLTIEYPNRKYRFRADLSRVQTLINTIQNHFDFGDHFRMVEIGVGMGRASTSLLWAFHKMYLSMIDPYEPYSERFGSQVSSKSFRKVSEEKQLEFMRKAAYATREYENRRMQVIGRSLDVVHHFQDRSQDCIYVDGLHDYQSVVDDVDAWWPILKNGGLFIGDNYGGHLDRKGYWGVDRAVNEFAKRLGYSVNVEQHSRSQRWGAIWWFIK
jgi:hypothetical protein